MSSHDTTKNPSSLGLLVRPLVLALAFGCTASLTERGMAQALDGSAPPSWRVDDEELYPTDDGPRLAAGRRQKRPARSWWVPRAALGIGLNFPELLPVEGYLFFGRYAALRVFYTPPLPIKIRVEMPSDVISTKKGVGVANPDFTIRAAATYGAHYGAEALVFPFGGSFFFAAGASRRSLRLVGEAKSPILVCSLVEAAKEPPCGDPEARIETQTELQLKVDARTSALLARTSVGWFWHVGSAGYFMLNLGATKPVAVRRSVVVTAGLDAPSTTDDDLTGALAQVKTEREADLAEKAKAELKPVDERVLPIAGIAAGIRF